MSSWKLLAPGKKNNKFHIIISMAPYINTKESEKLVPHVAPRTQEMVSFSYRILFLCSVTFYTYLFMQNRSTALLRLPWERKKKLLYIRMHRIYIVALCDNWTICNCFFFNNKKNSGLHLICWFFPPFLPLSFSYARTVWKGEGSRSLRYGVLGANDRQLSWGGVGGPEQVYNYFFFSRCS